MTFYPTQLSENHRHQLEVASDISPEITARRGTFTAYRGKDVPQGYGFLPQKPGLVFRVNTLDGGHFYRLRPNKPGKGPKYWQPKGHQNKLDVHPDQHERIKQPGGMRYVIEGEKKVDSGVSHDLLMIGLSGVWNGQKDNELIPDWEHLPLKGEQYSICFDSDIETNPHVQMAADRQARLLQQRGAEVFISLLPPAPDGTKQGLDDFFANGGTPKELELLTQPYESQTVERVRLTRDTQLRVRIEYLWQRWREADWMRFKGAADDEGNWARGHTARDIKESLIKLAMRHGKPDDRGVVVRVGLRTLSSMAAKSLPSTSKAIRHLEAAGQIEILPAEDKSKSRSYRLLVAAQPLHSMERESAGRGGRRGCEGDVSQGVKGLRAPTARRLRWSSPGSPRRKEFEVVPGSTRVRHTGAPPFDEQEERPFIKRLGPHRGAVVDTLEDAGGELSLEGLCEALHRRRPRDVRRRILKPLEEVGVIELDGDMVRLGDRWRVNLELERERSGEIEQAEDQKRKHRESRRRYREHLERERRGTPAASEEGARRGEELRVRRLREISEEDERDKRPTPAAVEEFVARIMGQNSEIRMGLLCDMGREEGLRWRDVRQAVLRGRFIIERRPEYDNEQFVKVFPPKVSKAPPRTLLTEALSAEVLTQPPAVEDCSDHSPFCDCEHCLIPEPKYARPYGGSRIVGVA